MGSKYSFMGLYFLKNSGAPKLHKSFSGVYFCDQTPQIA
ncbi:protein of unknown function [Sterolibacterium denitrificans]|uniref:Uncharacterized protein n=1 Tax=Sterolibacterium denitrificans TaxID=157592 RepID=A0A7Z7HQ67_9PROT|nr:protein of unknown function [Sterolibacterium denitrificans]